MRAELVYIFGFISGVLMVIIVRLVASRTFGGRYAESPVNCVEASTPADLLACDEQLDVELVHDLNSWLLQPELVALAGLFERSLGIWPRKTVQEGHTDRADGET